MNSRLEQNIKAVNNFIYIINEYEFRGGKYGDGLFLDKYVDGSIRIYRKDLFMVFSKDIDKIYVDIIGLKGFCLRYIEVYKLRVGECNNLLIELLLDLYSIPSYSYDLVYTFIGKAFKRFKMFYP